LAGTIFSLALSQQMDSQGKPLLNAPLFVYAANTSTPADTYEDYGLEIANPWPLRTDGNGRLPPFWLEDGAYRARLTDEAGAVVYFDIPFVQALGPSEGSEGGGGGGSVDADAIFQTGDMKWRPTSGTLTGWVRANGRTIGSATSGATERANADTQPLYEHLWNNFSNAVCAVTGGRGVSAASDFNANKSIAIYTMRGKGQRGLDDMGSSAAGVLTGGTPTVAGSSSGTEKKTIAKENLPSYTLPNTLDISGSQSGGLVRNLSESKRNVDGGPAANVVDDISFNTTTLSIAGSITSGGSGESINTMDPYMLGTFYVKL